MKRTLSPSLRQSVITPVSGIPSSAGYVPRWRIVPGTPGTACDQGLMPLTSAVEVEVAAAANQLTLTDTGIVFNAPVLGQAGR